MQTPPNNWILYYGNDEIKLNSTKDSLKKQGFSFFTGNSFDLYNECFSSSLFDSKSSLLVDSLYISPLEFERIITKGPSTKKSVVYFYRGTDLKINFIKCFSKNYKINLVDDKKIFTFIDALFKNDLRSTFSLLLKFNKDEDKIYLVNMLFFTLKNLLYFYYDFAYFQKLNPYVQLKTKQLASRINKDSLKSMLNFLSEVDYKIKISTDKDSVLFSTVFYLASIQ